MHLEGDALYIDGLEVRNTAHTPVFAQFRANPYPRGDYHFTVDVPLDSGRNDLQVIARRRSPPPCYSLWTFTVVSTE